MSTRMGSTLEPVPTRVAGSDDAGDLRLRRALLFMLAAFSSVAGNVWARSAASWESGRPLFQWSDGALSAPSLFLGRFARHLDDLIAPATYEIVR